MENYEYWVNIYAVVFSVLIASLSINSIFFIKNNISKVLAFISFTGLYSLILSYVFGKAYIGYTQQELIYKFIFEGYRSNIFHGNIYLLVTVVAFMILIWRLIYK